MDSRSMAKMVEKCFPGFRVRRSTRIPSGWDNIVLDVNGEYIFRFPRFKESEKNLRMETIVLPVFSKYLSTRIPKYEFIWKGNGDYPHWFAGYRKIDGVPITIGGFRRAWTRKLSVQLGEFLTELHSLKIPMNKLRSVPFYAPKDWLGIWKRMHRRVQRIVYPILDHELRGQVEDFWQRLFHEFRGVAFDPV